MPSGCASLTKLNQDGSALVYSTYFGGVGSDPDNLDPSFLTYANGVALAPNGDAILVGGTRDGAIVTTSGAYQTTCPTYTDGSCMSGFVASFDTNTNGKASLVFATYLGVPNGRAEAESVATDKYGDVYVVGQSTFDFPSVATFGTGTVPNVPYSWPLLDSADLVRNLCGKARWCLRPGDARSNHAARRGGVFDCRRQQPEHIRLAASQSMG